MSSWSASSRYLCVVALGVVGEDRPELADPDRRAGAAHELGAGEEGLLDVRPVDMDAAGHPRIRSAADEPRGLVVVRGVDGVRVELVPLEGAEVGRVAVAVEKQHMVGVDRAHRRDAAVVERLHLGVGRVARLVHQVVAGDRRVAAVAVGEPLPEVHDAVLEVAVLPEEGVVRRVVAVPVHVLRTRQRMQVEDRVKPVAIADLDDAVEQREALAPSSRTAGRRPRSGGS